MASLAVLAALPIKTRGRGLAARRWWANQSRLGWCAESAAETPPTARPDGARGFTLMELLLVLVLLVIAGSLVIPAITGAFDAVRLQRSGDVVMARWSEARAQAIETGVPYQFLFTPETGNYRVERWTQPPASESAPTAAATEPLDDNAQKTLSEAGSIAAALPETVQFLSGQEAVEDAYLRERRVNSLQTTGGTWSTPIVFFPDGSSSTATVVLQNDASQFVRLTLRGLTGAARSSGVLIRKEMDEGGQPR